MWNYVERFEDGAMFSEFFVGDDANCFFASRIILMSELEAQLVMIG